MPIGSDANPCSVYQSVFFYHERTFQHASSGALTCHFVVGVSFMIMTVYVGGKIEVHDIFRAHQMLIYTNPKATLFALV